MSDRERSRSRSPEPRTAQSDRYDENGNDPKANRHENGGGDGGDNPDEVKLYIGNLDYATDEQRLRDEFGQFGTISDVFLPKERDSGRVRGFGFVTYTTRAAAEEAIAKLDQTQLDGRTIRVNESRPRGEGPSGSGARGPPGGGGFNASRAEVVKLYVGNLSYDTNEDSLRNLFEQYGEVTDCFLPSDRDTGRPRGFAFVSMKARDAEEACEKCNGVELDGRTIRCNEAQPKESSRGGRGGGYDDHRGGHGGDRGGHGGGYDDRRGGGGYGGGGYGGGYDDRRGGYDDRRGGGYDDRGGYEGGRGGYDDRRGGGGYGGGGYEGGRGGGYRGGYEDRGGYGGGRGGGDDRGGYGGGGGYDDRGRY